MIHFGGFESRVRLIESRLTVCLFLCIDHFSVEHVCRAASALFGVPLVPRMRANIHLHWLPPCAL